MALQGGCQCRKIRYTVEFDEATAVKNFCHCRKCQLATGSPVSAFFTVQEVRQSATQLAALLKASDLFGCHALHRSQADVKFEGTLGVYQSSKKAVRKFCTNCGTPLVFQLVGNAKQELDIYTTTLDEVGRAAPTFHIWMQSKQPWLHLADDLPKYQQERSGDK
ncbi:TPA: hypothetical protein ACH3X3_006174 [Trebouxia sp. C0006]